MAEVVPVYNNLQQFKLKNEAQQFYSCLTLSSWEVRYIFKPTIITIKPWLQYI